MPRPPTILEVEKFVRRFLNRESAATSTAYTAHLEDFKRFAGEESAAAAVWHFLRGGPQNGHRSVERYQRSMTGSRNAQGKSVRGRGLSPATVNVRITVLRSLARLAMKEGLIAWMLDVKNVPDERVHDVRGPGVDVVNDMLAAAEKKPGAPGRRDYAILRLAGELGLRRGEIVRLDVEDFDARSRELRILGKGRTQKETLLCSPKTAEALTRWLEVRPRPRKESPLFTNLIPGRIGRISAVAVYVIVRGLGESALGFGSKKRISPHKLRHTAITTAVRSVKELGLAREDVRRFSRHKDFRMVARYLDTEDNAQGKLANAVGRQLR